MDEREYSLQMTQATRDALRRVRGAAVKGHIDAEEMQQASKETLHLFAKALLEVNGRSSMLKEEDQNPEYSHADRLNGYIKDLFPDVKEMNTAGNPIDNAFVDSILFMFSRKTHLDKFKHQGELPNVVALLSTGAIALAVSSYLHEIPLYVAAVNEERTHAIIPDIPGNKAVVVDDVVNRQVKLVGNQLAQRGMHVSAKDLLGQGN